MKIGVLISLRLFMWQQYSLQVCIITPSSTGTKFSRILECALTTIQINKTCTVRIWDKQHYYMCSDPPDCSRHFTKLKGPALMAQSDVRLTDDQEAVDWIHTRFGNILLWRLIVKYFLQSFSPFRWFKKGNWQHLVKEVHRYCLTTYKTKPAQERCG